MKASEKYFITLCKEPMKEVRCSADLNEHPHDFYKTVRVLQGLYTGRGATSLKFAHFFGGEEGRFQCNIVFSNSTDYTEGT